MRTLTCLLLALAPVKDDAAKAKELLDAVAAAMKDSPAAAFEVDTSSLSHIWGYGDLWKSEETPTRSTRKSLKVKRPNLLREESTVDGHELLVIWDGQRRWEYDGSTKRYSRVKYSAESPDLDLWGFDPAVCLYLDGGSSRMLKGASDFRFESESVGGVELKIIRWMRNGVEFRLWLQGAVPRKSLLTFQVATGMGGTCECAMTYSKIDLSPKLAEDAFTFAPPKDAVKMKDLEDFEAELLPVGSEAPDFEATDLEGKTVKLSGFRGKIVILVFWLCGCGGTEVAFPRLEKLRREYEGKGVEILAVNLKNSAEEIRNSLKSKSMEVSFKLLRQEAETVSGAYKVQLTPTNYIVGPDGKIVARWIGSEMTIVRTELDRLIEKK